MSIWRLDLKKGSDHVVGYGGRGLAELRERPWSSFCVVETMKECRGWAGVEMNGRWALVEGRLLRPRDGWRGVWSKWESDGTKLGEGWIMGLGEKGWGHLARKSVKWVGWISGGLIVIG